MNANNSGLDLCISISNMTKQFGVYTSIYHLIEKIIIVIQIKAFTFFSRLNSFFLKPPKTEETNIDCENSMQHFIF